MQLGPQGAAVTLKNNVIVSDALQKRLEVFTVAGVSLSKWGLGKFFNPCAVAVSANGNCVVSDTADHSVSVFRGEHTCVTRFGSKGSRDDQFDNPLYVTTGPSNEIAVSDSNNHCIKVAHALVSVAVSAAINTSFAYNAVYCALTDCYLRWQRFVELRNKIHFIDLLTAAH